MSSLAISLIVILPICSIIIGVIAGFYFAQKYFKKQQEENPPITREQIKAMYRQMGRTPSESQINSIIEIFKRQNKKNG